MAKRNLEAERDDCHGEERLANHWPNRRAFKNNAKKSSEEKGDCEVSEPIDPGIAQCCNDYLEYASNSSSDEEHAVWAPPFCDSHDKEHCKSNNEAEQRWF